MSESCASDLKGLCMPVEHTRITNVFGYRPRGGGAHHGLDIKVHVSDTIRVAFDSRVHIVENRGRRGYGKHVVICHDNGLETMYGHLPKQLANINQLVKAGEPIMLGDNTGYPTGSHLHSETRFLGTPISPTLMFDFEGQDTVAGSYTFRRTKGTSGTACSMASGKGLFCRVKRGDALSKVAAH